MKLLSLSGGATKFVGILSCAQAVIDSGFKPTHISGVSAGAIAALPLALGLYPEAKEKGLTLSLKDLFSSLPIKDNGKLTLNAVGRLLIGKTSLGIQETGKLVKTIITRYMFDKYKDGNYAECFLLAVNFSTGERVLFSVKDGNYKDYLDAVSASSHLPILSQPVEIDGEFYYDGGLRDHNPGSVTLDRIKGFNEVVSIYSRPKENTNVSEEWKDSFFEVLMRTIDIMNIEISKTDEQLEFEFCKQNKIKLNQYFLPNILTSLFDVDKTRLKELSDKSYDIGNKYK